MWRAHFLHFHHGSSGRSSSSICIVSCSTDRNQYRSQHAEQVNVNTLWKLEVFFSLLTRGTSLSTTVFRISIHSVRFCLLMSSRGRLYCGRRQRSQLFTPVSPDIKMCIKEGELKINNDFAEQTKEYLEEGIEDFKDLFLYEDRVSRVVREQLDEAFFQHGHENVHGGHQWLTLFWFLVPVSYTRSTSSMLDPGRVV